MAGVVYLIVRRLSGQLLSGWASVMVSIWMLGGLSIASMGVLGLYIARIFIETKQRPYSIIRAVHHFSVASLHDCDSRSTRT
jgi:putative glycosyltransferase